MLYKKYGSTGIDVSAIGFGGMRFPDQEDWEKGAALLKAAYDGGVNYFDTAPGYGKSEDIFGVALREMRKTRDARPFYISSKSMGGTPEAVRRDLENSLRRMGLDAIDFYHVWCIVQPDAYRGRKARGVLDEFARIKEEGLAKHICVSSHMTGSQIGEMLRDYPFEGVLLGYCAMNFAYRDEGVQAAHDLGRGVVVMNPLGGGLVPRHPDRFDFVRSRPDESVVEGALRFIVNDPRIAVALVGLDSEEHLREALDAVDGFRPIPEREIRRIREAQTEAFNELCTGCRYCDECPVGIPVPKYMEAYNHYALSGDRRAIVNRLRAHWGVRLEDDYLDRCTACGLCEDRCTQKLPVRRRLKEIRDEVARARREA
jgi:uncharacterized protein